MYIYLLSYFIEYCEDEVLTLPDVGPLVDVWKVLRITSSQEYEVYNPNSLLTSYYEFMKGFHGRLTNLRNRLDLKLKDVNSRSLTGMDITVRNGQWVEQRNRDVLIGAFVPEESGGPITANSEVFQV